MRRRELAEQYFTEGYNCCQSITLAFKDLVELDETTLLKLSSSFGGGMSRLREVCGAVSGMFMIIGLLYGYTGKEDDEVKMELYSRVQETGRKFESNNESLICRDLLGLKVKHDSPIPSARTTDYYAKRPCKRLIGDAADILEEYINNHPVNNNGK